MQKKTREEIPPETAAFVLFISDRTCCICRIRGKPIQIHHIDEDPNNNEQSNLAVVCFDCHRETQIRGGFDRKLDARQVTLYRDDWLRLVSQRRSELPISPPQSTLAQTHPSSTEVDKTGDYLLHAEYPVILWRMPRGALALSSLIRGHAGWATVADYFSYNGAWRGSTHYHVSYQRFWWQELGGLDLQCRKLHIERADWDYALRPLEMMCEIRHGHIIVLPDGTLEGDKVDRYYDAELVKVFVQEDVPFPRIPEIYFRLSISGALRDIAPEITDLCEESSNENLTAERADEIKSEIKRLRRIIRIEAHKVLSKDDPAMVNLLEIIDTFNPDVELKQYQTWAKELIGAVYEAVNQIHNIRQ